MRIQYKLLVAASCALGALALSTLATLATPEPAAAFSRSGLASCSDCASESFVTSCDGCDGDGGQCNNCGSCHDSCGGRGDNGSCWCDPACAQFGDCCHDYAFECSCAGRCGEWAASCWCDWDCHSYGDCCQDKVQQCGQCAPAEEPIWSNFETVGYTCWHSHDCCGTQWECRDNVSVSACVQ